MTETKRTSWKTVAEEYKALYEEEQRAFQVCLKKQVEFRNKYLETQQTNRELQGKVEHLVSGRQRLVAEIKWLKSVMNVMRDALASQIERQNDE